MVNVMANDVFANGREIACKSASGKTIASFPDVCFTPPECPATPPGVPTPYAVNNMASDSTEGSKNVTISGKEVMLKDRSYLKAVTGDEAGCATKKGMINSKNTGKGYFTSWSMDVKIEGENVVRHFDLTTNNHACKNANAAIPWPYVDSATMTPEQKKACDKDQQKEKDACKGYKPNGKKNPCPAQRKYYRSKTEQELAFKYAVEVKKNKCAKARRCRLTPFHSSEKRDGINGCCPGQTPHHLVPKACMKGLGKYDSKKAPCICVEGGGHGIGTHGLMHTCQSYTALKMQNPTLGKVINNAARTAAKVFSDSECNIDCIKAQLEKYHEKEAEIDTNHPIENPTETCKPEVSLVREAFQKAQQLAQMA